MVDQLKRQEFISIYIQGANNWRDKGVLAREVNSLSSALLNYLAIAVLDYKDSETAQNWFLSDDNYLSILNRYCESLASLVTKVDNGEVASSVIAGNYPYLVFAHLAWSINQIEAGEFFAEVAYHNEVMKTSTPFWQEYSRGINHLIEEQAYIISDLRPKGQEQYWLSYLRLIECATNRQDIESVTFKANNAFTKRNKDKTITDDVYEIEGSGLRPVYWDFRLDGLLNYIKKK